MQLPEDRELLQLREKAAKALEKASMKRIPIEVVDDDEDDDEDSKDWPEQGTTITQSHTQSTTQPSQFQAAMEFAGEKAGYVFKAGEHGMGYYKDVFVPSSSAPLVGKRIPVQVNDADSDSDDDEGVPIQAPSGTSTNTAEQHNSISASGEMQSTSQVITTEPPVQKVIAVKKDISSDLACSPLEHSTSAVSCNNDNANDVGTRVQALPMASTQNGTATPAPASIIGKRIAVMCEEDSDDSDDDNLPATLAPIAHSVDAQPDPVSAVVQSPAADSGRVVAQGAAPTFFVPCGKFPFDMPDIPTITLEEFESRGLNIPKSPSVHAALHKARGNTQFQSGDFTAAVASFTQAIQACPDGPIPYCNRAAAYLALKSYSHVVKDATVAIGLGAPESVKIKALQRRSLARVEMGDLNGGKADLLVWLLCSCSSSVLFVQPSDCAPVNLPLFSGNRPIIT